MERKLVEINGKESRKREDKTLMGAGGVERKRDGIYVENWIDVKIADKDNEKTYTILMYDIGINLEEKIDVFVTVSLAHSSIIIW